MHWVVLSLLLAIDPRGRAADISGGVVTELRGGRAPVVIDAEPEPAMLMIVIPNVDLRVRMRRRGAVLFGYAPRFVLRLPNVLGIRRPLVLHQLSMLYTVAISRRWEFSGTLTSSVGELDYTANNLVLGAMQGTAPAAAVLQYAVVEANTTLTARATPRDTFAFGPTFAFRTPMGDDLLLDEEPTLEQLAMIFPRQVTGGLITSYTRSVSPRDDLSLQMTPGVVLFEPGALFATFDGRLAWGRELRPGLRSRLDGGVFSAHVLDERDDPFGARSRLLPVGNAGLTGRLLSRARLRIETDVTAGINGFFDVLRGTVQPRTGGAFTLAFDMPPRWRAAVMTSFFTSANREPQTVVDGDEPLLDETVLYAQTPVTYMIDERMFFEFGTIVTARGPHLDVPDFSLGQLELWAYVAFRFSAGTARGRREAESRSGSIGGLGPAAGVTGAAIGTQRGAPPGAPAAPGRGNVAAPPTAGPTGTPAGQGAPYGPPAADEGASTEPAPIDLPPGQGELDDAEQDAEPEEDESAPSGLDRRIDPVDRRNIEEPVLDTPDEG